MILYVLLYFMLTLVDAVFVNCMAGQATITVKYTGSAWVGISKY
jgi:hypothetical protein